MTQQQALEVKDLAKPTVEALEVIVGSGEITCWKCDGSKVVQAHPHHYLTAPDKMWKCHVCNGIGKIGGWKWKPEVNQTVLYGKELMFIVSICQTRLILLPFDIPDFRESLEDYVCTPEIIDVIPILEWEEIEGVLTDKYNLVINTLRKDRAECEIQPQNSFDVLALGEGKSPQEAVMRSVIALGKKLGEEIK